jgi:glucan 1,3-beta-glucosidase
MSNGGTAGQLVESVVILDSTFTNTPIGISTAHTFSTTSTTGSLAIENTFFNNVPTIVKGPTSVTLAGNTGTYYLGAWVQGHRYIPNGPSDVETSVSYFTRPSTMVTGSANNYCFRSKPQYENVLSTNFVSVRTGGAKGDGVTDDTAAIQAVINSATTAGKIVYFDSGIYKISATLNIGPGARIVGEAYPVILASGTLWNNIAHPIPVVRVGAAAGQTGIVEWSDMIVSTQGAMAGAVLIQWNLASPAASPSGMWDVHTRIGGFKGSNLQTAQCPITGTQPNANCTAAWQSMLIGDIGNGVYMENNWFWTADHDLDDVLNNNTRVSVYSGRGISIESTVGNIWLVGTAVEHHDLYQYQLFDTKNVFMGFIQTETPYYQPSPSAVTPFAPFAGRNDPDFSVFCKGKAASCNMAWGLRVLNSTSALIYGAGLYSFFNNYDTTCSDHTTTAYNEYCQTQILGIDEGGTAGAYSGSSVFIYGLNTVGSVSMIDWLGSSIAAQSANTNVFVSSVIRFVTKTPGT